MRRSKDSPGRRRRLLISGPLTLVSLFTLLLSIWLGRGPGPLKNIELPGGASGTRTIGSPPIVVVPSRSAPPPRRAPEPNSTLGVLEIRVEDQQQRRRSGVLLEIDGPTKGRILTGVDGVALLEDLRPGRYDVEVRAGCVRDLEIFQGRRGTAEVFAGRTSILRLSDVEARPRFWPTRPVSWSSAPAWKAGRTVTISFSVFDRCEGKDVVPGTSFARLGYVPNELVSIVGQPPTAADGESSATVRFRCVQRGTPSLLLWDPDTGESQDLLLLTPGVNLTPMCA